MSKVTQLATGQITTADSVTIELIEVIETPAVVLIRWPGMPTVTNPRQFPAVAVAAIHLLDDAMQQLAATVEAGEL